MQLIDEKLDCFGCLIAPVESTVIVKGDFCAIERGMFDMDADIAFITGSPEKMKQYYSDLSDLYADTEGEEWLNDEGMVGFAYYPLCILPDDKAMVACIDSDSGVFGDEPQIDLPEGCEMVFVVHACQKRCFEEAPEFFKGLDSHFVF